MGYKKIIGWGGLVMSLTLGAFLRIWWLDKAPPAVNWDEASYGYNAFSLWQTGKDEYGSPLPTSIRSFDDFKPPLYAYATAPVVGLWGLNEFDSRLVAAVSGMLTILLIFVWATRLTGNLTVGLLAAAILATAPWAVHFSRLAFEAVLALPLLIGSWIYLLKAEKRPKYFLAAMGLAVVSFFAYNSHKVYLPLVLLWVGWRLKNQIKKHWALIIGCGLLLVPLIYAGFFLPAF